MRNTVFTILVAAAWLPMAGCTAFWQAGQPMQSRDGVSSSLVDYLYPRGEVPPEVPAGVPQLELPLRVGVAFVPASGTGSSAISETMRMELLQRVSDSFIERRYIEHIEIIPDTYLRSARGIGGMQQAARMFAVDVMALVSYDQMATSSDRDSSLLYWTIVGAYVVHGTNNEVQTFVDTAVFDVASRRLLFRAPGIDRAKARSTAVEAFDVVRDSRRASFGAAMEDMTANLDGELTRFEQRLKEDPSVASVSWEAGGGGLSVPALLLLALWSVSRKRRNRTTLAASGSHRQCGSSRR